MNWLTRHAAPLEALAALITALVAVAALIAVPLQIRANEKVQAEQSAREIYREFVALSVQKPELADPDICALRSDAKQQTSYAFYVEYMLYTAEQVVELDPSWGQTMAEYFAPHGAAICEKSDLSAYSDNLARLISAFQTTGCPAPVTC